MTSLTVQVSLLGSIYTDFIKLQYNEKDFISTAASKPLFNVQLSSSEILG